VQGCVGVSTLIEAAAGAARTDQDQMLECLDDARVHLRLTIDEARQALTDLRHDSFEHGLPGALREWTGTMRNDKGIPIRLHVTGEAASLGDADQRALLLVIREAVRNAATHGRPQSIEVSLRYTPQAIEIDVQDDGIGFAAPEAELADRGHFGILGMRERIEQLGGSLEVCSEPGAGTTVSARVPLPPKH
jgi:signal transduction histidine kinase